MTNLKRWKLKPQTTEFTKSLSESLSISPLLAQLLINRNITTIDQAKKYLDNDCIPSQFNEEKLEQILEILESCIQKKRPILIYGDYDVDGMSSTAMMVKLISSLGGIVRYKIPHRFDDGYGITDSIVQLLQKDSIQLLITLDCGITNAKEIALIKQHTPCEVIIFDHHTIPKEVPPADAILNPKELPLQHPLYDLCTAGIVYQFVTYVATKHPQINPDHYIDLAALATVADVVNLQGENRNIVKKGLRKFSQLQHPGIKALLEVSGIKKEVITEQDFGFLFAPRLNASGRLSTAHHGVDLLLATTEQEAMTRALRLEKLNQSRKELDQEILKQAINEVETNPHYANQSIIIIGSKNWHAGVIGITASKLVDRFSKPVVIVAFSEDGYGRGSSRSLGDINIYSLLNACKDHFLKFGGHKQAAGFSITQSNFTAFKAALELESSKQINQKALYDCLDIDVKLNADSINLELVNTLYTLSPFGQGNEEPLFYTDQLQIIDSKVVGAGKHLKLTVRDQNSNKIFDAIGFGLANKLSLVYKNDNHLVFHLNKNHWNGKTTVQLVLKDIK
jgi:single-stranded-DNA-specific exonuclease